MNESLGMGSGSGKEWRLRETADEDSVWFIIYYSGCPIMRPKAKNEEELRCRFMASHQGMSMSPRIIGISAISSSRREGIVVVS